MANRLARSGVLLSMLILAYAAGAHGPYEGRTLDLTRMHSYEELVEFLELEGFLDGDGPVRVQLPEGAVSSESS